MRLCILLQCFMGPSILPVSSRLPQHHDIAPPALTNQSHSLPGKTETAITVKEQICDFELIFAQGCQFCFFEPNYFWNRFDTYILTISQQSLTFQFYKWFWNDTMFIASKTKCSWWSGSISLLLPHGTILYKILSLSHCVFHYVQQWLHAFIKDFWGTDISCIKGDHLENMASSLWYKWVNFTPKFTQIWHFHYLNLLAADPREVPNPNLCFWEMSVRALA